MDHRRDLEGLRGIAILSVVLYHLNASVFPGGFIGVDQRVTGLAGRP
jgi:peptidoglycan/LPS O-acetylase OafA/YrhL